MELALVDAPVLAWNNPNPKPFEKAHMKRCLGIISPRHRPAPLLIKLCEDGMERCREFKTRYIPFPVPPSSFQTISIPSSFLGLFILKSALPGSRRGRLRPTFVTTQNPTLTTLPASGGKPQRLVDSRSDDLQR
jgi:hypothetical protein